MAAGYQPLSYDSALHAPCRYFCRVTAYGGSDNIDPRLLPLSWCRDRPVVAGRRNRDGGDNQEEPLHRTLRAGGNV